MKNRLVAAELEPDEVVFSMDVESLYTNVPLVEAILLATDKLYASDKLRKLFSPFEFNSDQRAFHG